ncbi:MAG: barstar family protein [Castellaniella sp.]|uniref:barstar family protein n=1 Tax=Castellaniella sp. TaxID=1955812 RepID=UPI002A35F607|nr:barstar family protein [Castellaniella sp.]MDY0308878.1 barstar family protein [Castellaniella sp.]
MSPAQIKKMLTQGVVDARAVSEQEALAAASEAGLAAFVVDCDRARNRSAVLRAVVKAIDYPEYFGSNLDALYDGLCDTLTDQKEGLFLWFRHLHSGDPVLADEAGAIQAVCDDVVEFGRNNERRFAYAIQHAGAHPDPEPGVEPTPYSGREES